MSWTGQVPQQTSRGPEGVAEPRAPGDRFPLVALGAPLLLGSTEQHALRALLGAPGSRAARDPRAQGERPLTRTRKTQ